MKWISIILLVLVARTGVAQQPGSIRQEPYKKNPTIPNFSLLQVDSTTLRLVDLKKNEPTIIMYFSPTCEHCIHQMEDMMKRLKDLKRFQIVMATYQPFQEMVDFYKKYKIAELHNFRMGRDTKFAMPPFYVIHSLPYFALYNKKGILITTFESDTKVDTLIQAFAKK